MSLLTAWLTVKSGRRGYSHYRWQRHIYCRREGHSHYRAARVTVATGGQGYSYHRRPVSQLLRAVRAPSLQAAKITASIATRVTVTTYDRVIAATEVRVTLASGGQGHCCYRGSYEH